MANDQRDADGPGGDSGGISRPELDPNDYRLIAEAACQNAGFATRWEKDEPADDDDGPEEYRLSFALPNGRYTRWLYVSESRAQFIESAGIAPSLALGDYEAVLYKDTYEIEALLRPMPASAPSLAFRLSRLPGANRSGSDVRSDEEAVEIGEPPWVAWTLPFHADSDQTWSANIERGNNRIAIYTTRPSGREISVKISGVKVSRHDEALKVLEDVTNAIFFEMDLRYGVSATLARLPIFARLRRIGPSGRSSSPPRMPLERSVEPPRLPRNSYPAKPLALYWYARSAANMPLLQYLASYQVLEYYFPTYYQREALDRMKQELLDPRFSPQSDADLIRLLSLATPQGRNFGSEREQLRATIRACVSVDRLQEYLSESSRKEFFAGKQVIKDVSRIDLNNATADLRDQVGDRVYDIRCRIVHAKSDSGDRYPELLLPFSEESDSLVFDIGLVQYLAQRILIQGAWPLNL